MFRLHWRGPSRIATDTKHTNTGRLQWVLPKVAKSLGSLYTSPIWLLRRWLWKLGLKVTIHVITSKCSEILGSTSYVTIFISRSNTHFHQFYLVERLLQLWYSYVLLYSGNNIRCELRKASECTGIIMSCIQLLTYLKSTLKNTFLISLAVVAYFNLY